MKLYALLLLSLPVLVLNVSGHHSLTAEFDLDRTVTLEGSVERVEWMNPHAWIRVRTESGVWAVEVGSPSDLVRRGWSRSDLAQGARLTIQAILAKKLPRTANARVITLANGKQILKGKNVP